MHAIMSQLNLRERSGTTSSGRFVYRDPTSKNELEFRWDGAGVDREGNIVLLEEEGTFSNLHIQGHLARVSLMITFGEPVKKLIWIVSKKKYPRLRNLVESWVSLSKNKLCLQFPTIEYRTKEGNRLYN